MCRTGGRRCPGHDAPAGRAAHNARRRRNREIKAAIVDEAVRRGANSEVVEQLRKGSPEQAKEWAQANELPSHVHPGRGHTHDALPPLVPGPADNDDPKKKQAIIDEAIRRGEPAFVVERLRQKPTAFAEVWWDGKKRQDALRRGPAPVPARPAKSPILPELVSGTSESADYNAHWRTPALGHQIDKVVAGQGKHRDEANLLAGVKTTIAPVGGGTNTTRKVELDNGIVGYHKPFSGLEDDLAGEFGQSSAQQPVHEVAAWQVAKEMGPPWDRIVAPVVLREVDGEMGSFALERPGIPMRHPFTVAPEEVKAAAFFDALVGQQDRHPGNYLVQGDRVNLIDHGYTFARGNDYSNHSFFVRARRSSNPDKLGPRADMLTGSEVDALDRFLDSPTSWGLLGVLEPDRLAAMRARALKMRESGRLLKEAQYE